MFSAAMVTAGLISQIAARLLLEKNPRAII